MIRKWWRSSKSRLPGATSGPAWNLVPLDAGRVGDPGRHGIARSAASKLRGPRGNLGRAIGKIRVVDCAANGDPERDMKPVTEPASIRERDCVLCPLNRVKAGVEVRIKQLCASPEVAARLREIGFGEQQIIRLITSQANIICQVCNARLAISARLAQAILVEPVPAPAS